MACPGKRDIVVADDAEEQSEIPDPEVDVEQNEIIRVPRFADTVTGYSTYKGLNISVIKYTI